MFRTVGASQLYPRPPESDTLVSYSRQQGGVMRVKSVSLYSLPYVVAIVGILVAAHQVGPTLQGISLLDTNAKNETFSGQAVNRSRKSNRLPIESTTPQTPAKRQINMPVKSRETIIV